MNEKISFAAYNHLTQPRDEQLDVLERARSICPVMHSEQMGGYWMLTRYEDVEYGLRTYQDLSSAKWQDEDGVWWGGDTIPSIQAPPFLVLETDPPVWREQRALLNPFFTPAAARSHKPWIESLVDSMLEEVLDSGEIDFARQLAYAVPTLTTLRLLGIETREWVRFSTQAHKLTHFPPDSPEGMEGLRDVEWGASMLRDAVLDRQRSPTEDLTSAVANGQVNGVPVSVDDAVNILRTVIGGGVDTTGATLLAIFHHLHRNPEDRRRLIEDRTLLPKAIEEFLRMWPAAPVAARTSVHDLEISSCPVSSKEIVGLSILSANRDEGVFDTPDEVVIDRTPNRHLTFGAGVHRCIGHNFARLELITVLDRVLTVMPDFRLDLEREDVPNQHLFATFTPRIERSRKPA